MSLEESKDDELNLSKLSLLDRTISIDFQSLSSQSSIEEPISPIKTNLNEAQLALFRSHDEDSKSKLSICTDENPIWIEFPGESLNLNASISLFQPDSDEKHDKLKLVPVNDKYPIHNGEIVFKVHPEFLKELKLDFFAIQFTDDHEKKNDIDDAYKRNTARLCIKNYDNDEKLVAFYKSQIIRNKNLEVSEDISILQIKQDKKNPTEYLLRLDHSVPYFLHELEIKVCDKKYIPTTKNGFPIRELIIRVPEKSRCNSSNTRILCKIFRKESIPKQIQMNPIIEKRKKKNKQNREISKISETNSSTLIPESKETKEMCLVINQIEFDDKNLESRKSHSKYEINEIKDVFSKTLNYDVHILTDLTTLDLKDEINNRLDNFNEKHDHIVVFVFSHGDNNMFHTRDGSIKYDEFVKLFFRKKNYDKPKIFFISCCQGKKVNTLNKSLIPKGIIETASASNENFIKINLPEYSNVFMGFSSVSDYYSLRVNSETPYIQTLLAVIRENPALPVTEIHNITQCRVNWRDSLTISCVYHCLTKEVYFKQKENN